MTFIKFKSTPNLSMTWKQETFNDKTYPLTRDYPKTLDFFTLAESSAVGKESMCQYFIYRNKC